MDQVDEVKVQEAAAQVLGVRAQGIRIGKAQTSCPVAQRLFETNVAVDAVKVIEVADHKYATNAEV